MHAIPYGDAALVVGCDRTVTSDIADILRARVPLGYEVVPAIDTVAVLAPLGALLDPSVIKDVNTAIGARPGRTSTTGAPTGAGELREIPVCYDGPDLADVARTAGVSSDEVVRRHAATTYDVAMVGFAPGFAYLRGLDTRLRIGRRATPRASVPALSVAIAGEWTAVYPSASPGGWHVLGRTNITMFDPHTPANPAMLRHGDRVRFVPVHRLPVGKPDHDHADHDHADHDHADHDHADHDHADHDHAGLERLGPVEVIEPGLTFLQDLGRPGYANVGVSRSGAADRVSLQLANRLVGNPDGEAALECTLHGPHLRFHEDRAIAAVGAPCDLPAGQTVEVAAGQEVRVGAMRGDARTYVAVEGGIAIRPVLGSRSTDTLGQLGPSRLSRGDRLLLGPTTGGRGVLRTPVIRQREVRVLRVLPGLHGDGLRFDREYTVQPTSDRIGVRLEGPVASAERRTAVDASLPMVTGAVQIPPDGHPIVLLADHGTTGGYPVVAVVATADLPILAQARPGDPVRFLPISLDAAREAWRGQQAWSATAVARLDRLGR